MYEALGGEEVTFVTKMTPAGGRQMRPTLSAHRKQRNSRGEQREPVTAHHPASPKRQYCPVWGPARWFTYLPPAECRVWPRHRMGDSCSASGPGWPWTLLGALLWPPVWLSLPGLSVALLGTRELKGVRRQARLGGPRAKH